MKTFDFYYVAVIALTLCLDHFVLWRMFLRRSQVEPVRARLWLWFVGMAGSWAVTGIGMVWWTMAGRKWTTLGLTTVPMANWRLIMPVVLTLALLVLQGRSAVRMARASQARRLKIREQLRGLEAMLPHTRAELAVFFAVSLTAGFCEEVVFRGYLVWFFQPWLGWWGAALLSSMGFALAHAYQGTAGIWRTGSVGIVMALIVAVCQSLWPAIVLHALIDVTSGITTWLVLRDGPTEEGGATDAIAS